MSKNPLESLGWKGRALVALSIAVVAAVFGAAVGPAVTAMLNAKPKLHYELFLANVVTDAGVSTAIYAVHVSNDGGSMAENISMVITIPKATLSNISVSPPPISTSHSVAGSALFVSGPELNAGESFDVKLEAQSTEPLPSRADVNLRAKNANGREWIHTTPPGLLHDFTFLLSLICVIGSIALLVMSKGVATQSKGELETLSLRTRFSENSS